MENKDNVFDPNKTNNNNEANNVEGATRKCRKCGQILPITMFDKYGTHGYHTACRACEGKDCGTDERFKDISSRELILELRARGYKGELQKITINKVVI